MKKLIPTSLPVLMAIVLNACGLPSDLVAQKDPATAAPVPASAALNQAPVTPRPWPFGQKLFRIAVLPDTQHYSGTWPDHFTHQTQWIVNGASKTENPIVAVFNLGDITDDNSKAQWDNAEKALKLFDGAIPFALTIGNHDLSRGGHASDRTTLFHEYFPPHRFKNLLETFEGGRAENSLHRFFTPDRQPFFVLLLEFAPRNTVLDWAKDVIRRHPGGPILLATHEYLTPEGVRSHEGQPSYHPRQYGLARPPNPYANDGEEVFQKLVAVEPRIVMVLNGHYLDSGVARLLSANDEGQPVYQMLSNYQTQGQGGDGFLRVLQFAPARKAIQVQTYSPSKDAFRTDPEQFFEVDWQKNRFLTVDPAQSISR